jgi:DNA-nicking Smr family endonuclease
MKTLRYSVKSFKDLKEDFKSNNKYILIKKNISDNKTDEEIFLDAMADVREIKEFREISPKEPPRIKQLHSENDDSFNILRQIVNGKRRIRLSDTGEYIEWVSPNIRKDIAQRLHQGHFSVQDFIDLHGMTVSEAEEAFSKFFKNAVRKHLFCIKVIHGRGLRSSRGPVLKEALKKWLHGTFRKWILAYSTAKDSDGGLGATYIILKISR